jgi:TRAP-type C4-dicarboxylate transport system substrate-binding protein
MGFYEPANYVLELNAGADSMYVYMNNDLYETGLTDAQRELIVQCAKDAGDYYSELTYDALATNRANWEAAGVETITLSPEEAERWAEITFAYAYKQEEEGVWEAGLFDKCREIVEATRAGS